MIPVSFTFLVYFSLFFCLEIFSVPAGFSSGVSKRRYDIFVNIFVPVLLVSLFLGLRYDVGVDYHTYEAAYYHPETSGAFSVFEPGYKLISIALGYLGVPYYVLCIIVVSISFIFSYFLFSNEPSIKRNWYWFFYFTSSYLFFCLNVQRQAVAMCIFQFAFIYIHRKQFIRYLLLILLAACFHYSALVLIMLYPLPSIFKNRGASFYFMFLVLALILQIPLKMLIEKLVIAVSSITPWARYGELIVTWETSTGSGVGFLIRLLMTFVVILYFNKLRNKYGALFYTSFLLYFLGTVFNIYFEYNMLLRRVMLAAISLNIIVYSLLCDYLFRSKKLFNFFTGICVFLLFSLYFIGQIAIGSNKTMPFQFVFWKFN